MTLGARLRPRQGLLLGLGLALLLIGAAHLAVEGFLDHERQQAEAAAYVEAGRDAQAARLTLYRTLDAVEALGQVVQERHALAEQGNRAGAAAMESLAIDVVGRRAFGVLQVAVIDADGRVAWSSVEGWKPVDLSDRPHFRAHLPAADGTPPPDRLYFSEPLVGRISGQAALQASRPVFAANGRFAGVSVISLDPLDLARLLRELLPDERGVISVIRTDGVFLSRSRDPGTTIGRRLKPDSPALRLIEAGQEGNIRTRGSLGGRDIIAAVRRLEGTPLYVSANIDVAQSAGRQRAGDGPAAGRRDRPGDARARRRRPVPPAAAAPPQPGGAGGGRGAAAAIGDGAGRPARRPLPRRPG